MTAKHARLPWLKWYPADFLSSSRVQRMTLEEQGAYRRLLDFQWMDGSIPSDMGDVARLLGVSRAKAARIWVRVGPCFAADPDDASRLVNDRLASVRAKAKTTSDERSLAGKAGATAKWGDGKHMANAMANECQTACQTDGESEADAESEAEHHPATPPEGASPAGAGGVVAVSANGSGKGWHPKHEATATLADYHARAVRHWKPDARINPASVKSLRGFDAMLTVDKRDPQQTRTILAWIFRGEGGDYDPRGDFDWRPNLLSGDSVRRAWDKLDVLFKKALEPEDVRPPRRF